DTRSLTLIKTYVTEGPVNAVTMSPLLDHILQEEIGGVKGHFGPINALAFNPDGKRYLASYVISWPKMWRLVFLILLGKLGIIFHALCN
ncbi:Eukaryotic translation initiation factor 3 subunit I, partial [Dionaea muscipula]